MNQTPTPLGLQETIAESIYITRPLLHRILPWLRAGSDCTLGGSRRCCRLSPGAAPGFSLPAAALLRQSPRDSSLLLCLDAHLNHWSCGCKCSSPFPKPPSITQACILVHTAALCWYPGDGFGYMPLIRHLWFIPFLDCVFLVLSLGVWGQRSWKPWLLSAVLDISRSV